jgi:uncharacterized damage-inducible protein DinB
MSVFTNPFDGARDEADAYIRALLDLLGDRDPWAVLAELPAVLESFFAGLDREQTTRPEAPGRWKMRDVVCHLADSELVWGWRLRRILAEDHPPLSGFDQDRWAERLRYRDQRLEEALAVVRALRTAHLSLLRSLPTEDRERAGVHSERGEESVRHLLRLYAGHDLVHRQQLERIRQRVAPRPAPG